MRRTSGFTLIELMIVIGIIGLLAAVLIPALTPASRMANVFADGAQLQKQGQWLRDYRQKLGYLPSEGGSRFVMTPWVTGVVAPTVENFDCYFTPGSRENDPDWIELRKRVMKRDNPFPTMADVTSLSTHYAGRAREHMRTRESAEDEALLGNDNEGVWRHADGTVQVLLSGGKVRSYSHPQLVDLFGVPPLDQDQPIATTGATSPIAECRKLAL